MKGGSIIINYYLITIFATFNACKPQSTLNSSQLPAIWPLLKTKLTNPNPKCVLDTLL